MPTALSSRSLVSVGCTLFPPPLFLWSLYLIKVVVIYVAGPGNSIRPVVLLRVASRAIVCVYLFYFCSVLMAT